MKRGFFVAGFIIEKTISMGKNKPITVRIRSFTFWEYHSNIRKDKKR